MAHRISSAILAAALAFSYAAPAFAEVKASDAPEIRNPCLSDSGDRDRCIRDAAKVWVKALKDFTQLQEDEREAWKDEHAKMGISEEYKALYSAFVKKQHDELAKFKKKIQDFKKTVTDIEKGKKEAAAAKPKINDTGTAKTYTKTLTEQDVKKANEICQKLKGDRAERVCIRQQLKTKNPDAKTWMQR